MTDHTDVVFTFNYVNWRGAVEREMAFAQDRLARRLLEDDCVQRLIIGGPYRGAARRAGRRLLGQGPVRGPGAKAVLFEPLRLRGRDPIGLRALERAYDAYGRGLGRLAKRLGLNRPAVLTTHPLIAGLAPLGWAGRVTYYATDDWAASPEYSAWWPAFEHSYERIRVLGTQVCAVSAPIVDRIQPAGRWRVVPNGVEPSEWEGPPGPPPAWYGSLARPRILYVGTLDERLDVARLTELARALPHASLVLAGPARDSGLLDELARAPNVTVRGSLSRADVATVVRAADVCLLPHRATRFTLAMSPLKVYEYLAGGAPVVATDLTPVHGVHERVTLLAPGAPLAAGVMDAIEAGRLPESERRAFIVANSWSRRHDALLDLALEPA